MIQSNEIPTPSLTMVAHAALLTAANVVDQGLAEVTVSLTYTKQTDTKARIAGEDYVGMPGVTGAVQTGALVVERYVDNPVNRKQKRVGKVYFRVRSITRADGATPIGYTNMRPEGITAFVILGTKLIQKTEA